ncbi:MAG: hypothetical protein LBD78_10940 [Spirochaetaceae bacterium]|nr:hypothetical protein [Spirochaetaceae bacterium]
MLLAGSCTRTTSGNVSIVPPPTPLLSRQFIGYGVINVSYTHVTEEPVPNGVSLGYLRKGSVVQVLERRSVNNRGTVEIWVLVNGVCRGWLREDLVQVYSNEAQAKTAAETMDR